MKTQTIYTSFASKLQALIVLTLFAWGNAWAQTYTAASGEYILAPSTGGDLTSKTGSNWDVLGTSWLILNGGGTIIIEGDLILKTQLHIEGNTTVIIKGMLKNDGNNYIYVTAGSSLAVLGFSDAHTRENVSKFSKETQIHKDGLGSGNRPNKDDVFIMGSGTYNSDVVEKNALRVLRENPGGLLPISLTSFSASQNGEEIEIAWTTNSEVNNDYFTVEYSIDGVSFKTLETVAGSGTTSEVNDYTITTEASQFNGVVYFRLKQTDYNGEYSYSDVITLMVESSNELYVYPNPATEFVSVSGAYKTAIVQDMFGKKVAVATNGEQIFVGNLSSGTYYVVVATENGKKVLSFVKE